MAGPDKAIPANVVITLVNDDDNTVPFLKRTLLLDGSKPAAPIGRASKVSSKGFIAAHDNAWFESAVMSRNHAEIVADFEKKKVYIRDIGSLHGTFVNTMQEGAIDKKLHGCNELQEITEGAKVTLGVPIVRNNEAFAPTSLRVRITHGPRSRIPNHNPALGSTFSVPEFVDDSSSDEEDTEPAVSPSPITPKVSPVRPQDVVDLTTEADNDLIDLTSPIRPLSPALPEDHHMNDELEDQPMSDNMASERMPASASAAVAIVDDASELSYNGSPSIRSYDDDDEEIDDDSDDGSDSTSSMGEGIDWNSRRSKSVESGSDKSDDDNASSLDNDSIADDSEFGSHHGYDAEYSSDDDVIDQDDPDTAVWPEEGPDSRDSDRSRESSMPVLVQPFAVPLSLPPVRQRYVHAEPLSIPELMNPTTNEALAEDMHEALAEGMRATGRDLYFAACTENRTNSVPTAPLPETLPTPAALAASVGVLGDRPPGPGFPRCLNEFVAPAKEKATTHYSRMANCWPAPAPVKDIRQVLGLAESNLLKSGDAFLVDPHQLAATDIVTGTPSNKADDEDDMPISAHALREKKRIAYNLRFDKEASASQPRSGALKISDLLYEAQDPHVEASGVVAVFKGKRKSEEISTLTEKEKAWETSMISKVAEAGATLASQSSLPSKDDSMVVDGPEEAHPKPSPAEISAQIPAEALLIPASAPTPVPAPLAYRQEIRPAKRQRVRNIAERLGYAALGGVSVGAAIVTTLIYTAPTF